VTPPDAERGPDFLTVDAALAALALLRTRVQAGSSAAAAPHQVELVDAWTARFGEGERGMRMLLAAVVEQAQLLQGDPAGAEERLAEAEMLLLGRGAAGAD
jgi:hypothetical protein